MSTEWKRARRKPYELMFREGKVGEIVKCWFGNAELKEGQVIIKKVNGEITLMERSELLSGYDVVEEKSA